MDIRSEFWSAVKKSENRVVNKTKKPSKVITLYNESAHYYDVITNENLGNDIDAEIMYLITKTKKEREIIQELEEEDLEWRRNKWRKENRVREFASFTPSSSSSAGAGGGSGNRTTVSTNNYVQEGYVVNGYFGNN